MEVPTLGQSAAKMREESRTLETPGPTEAVTAFLVYVTSDGRYIMDTDLDADLIAARQPTRHEVIAACECVAADIRRQTQTEELTMTILGNLSRMMSDPQYHLMVDQARQAAVAAAGQRAPAPSAR